MTELAVEESAVRRRPFGLWMVIGLQTVLAIAMVLYLFGFGAVDPYLRFLYDNPLYLAGGGWVYLAILLLAILGMLRLRRWGWVLTMFMVGLGLLFDLWAYFQGAPNYPAMVINIVIVFYMNQRDVQSPFVRWNP